LTIWHLVEVMRMRKKSEKEGLLLPIIILIFIILSLNEELLCKEFISWLLLATNVLIFVFSMSINKK